jgi:pyruvate formate lyase activating enzyme
MQIHGLNKTTLLDYPGRVAATIFTGGCNFRCPFCHNGDLVLNPDSLPSFSQEEIYSFLEKRKNVLSGVCITGGEPTLQKDLKDFLIPIKKMGYLIKLDTNGTFPAVVKDLYENGLLDYVAMDIKSSPENYEKAAGISSLTFEKIRETAAYIMTSGMDYEFRTTVVKELHNSEDFLSIARWLKNCNSYFLQDYQDSENVISTGFHSYSKSELEVFRDLIKPYIFNVNLRGVE